MGYTIDFPDSLEVCIEKFWADNPDLKRAILRDWYNGDYVTGRTNLQGFKAMDKWLRASELPNGEGKSP